MNSRFCRSFVADVSASALIDSPPHIPVRHSVRLYYGSTVERVDICVVVVLRMESRLQVVCDRQDLKARPVSKNRGQGLNSSSLLFSVLQCHTPPTRLSSSSRPIVVTTINAESSAIFHCSYTYDAPNCPWKSSCVLDLAPSTW
ncbi:hypothetical protein C8R45DRAFT_1209210 [Mycena sanguinolenta]|nr:hypothetical protein C8R45DRAFT_1209210 [Mycena sanguinolenta]